MIGAALDAPAEMIKLSGRQALGASPEPHWSRGACARGVPVLIVATTLDRRSARSEGFPVSR